MTHSPLVVMEELLLVLVRDRLMAEPRLLVVRPLMALVLADTEA